MAEQISIQRLAGLVTALRGLPRAVQGKQLQVGMRKGGNVIRDEARRRAPRASGYLSKQIVVRKASTRAKGKAGVGPGGEYFTVGVRTGKKRKYAGTRRNRRIGRAGKLYEESGWAYYWRHVEFGSKRQSAQPFLTPAAEAKGPEAAQVIIDETYRAIDKYLRGNGAR